MKPLGILFAGTSDFSVPSLKALLSLPDVYQVIAVYTQPDRPSGRGQKPRASAVKEIALEHQLPIYQPVRFSEEDIKALRALKPDLMIVVSYGLLLPKEVLDAPRFGCINIHASLLPRWRGAAPIQRAIAAGDKESGVCIMQMEKGLDTGPIWLKKSIEIKAGETSQRLHDRLMRLGADALLEALPIIVRSEKKPMVQSEENATYAKKITKEEARINWMNSASEIDRLVRAFNPWPVAYTRLNGQHIRLWSCLVLDVSSEELPGRIIQTSPEGIDVSCGEGVLRILELQPPGRRRMSAADYLNSKIILGKGFD